MPRKPALRTSAPPEAPSPLSYAAFTAFGQETIDSVMRTNAAWSTGLETLRKECAGFVRANFESTAEAARALLDARTLEDVLRLQTDFAKSQFERLIERSAKLSELGCSALRDAMSSWGTEGEMAPAGSSARSSQRRAR